MQLEKIYGPVKKDLLKVEKQFDLLAENQKNVFPELHSMLKHLLVGGKALRPTLTFLSGKFYNYDIECLLPMATAGEMLHIATLVHDDAIDKADIRRGKETINKIWGLEKAVLMGDFLFAKAGEFAADTGSLVTMRLFSQTLGIISRAELRQGFSAFRQEQNYDDYLERITGKTAALLAMATKSGAVLSKAPDEVIQALKNYGYNLGIAFQIVDDILDFTSTEAEMGKPVGSDLFQGTVTLPSLMLMQRYPDDNPIKRLFNDDGDKHQNVKKAIEMVKNLGFIEESYKIAEEYKEKACLDLGALPDNAARQSLYAIADYVLKRRK